ncbi:MAG: glycosyltransferase family 2 protein [Pirellulales bacterium]
METLSVVLPVHNVEATLARQVRDLLELLDDWNSRFEILVVDDGSTDRTPECAADLAAEFPQLRWVRSGRRQGKYSAIRRGLGLTTGQVVVVHDAESPACGFPKSLLHAAKQQDVRPTSRPSVGAE